MNNSSPRERERGKLIQAVQDMLAKGYKIQEIARVTGISTRTVIRYRTADATGQLGQRRRKSELNTEYARARVLQLIKDGYHISGIHKILREEGIRVSRNTLREHIEKISAEEGVEVSRNKKGPAIDERRKGFKAKEQRVIIGRGELMDFLWSGIPLNLNSDDMDVLYEKYPVVKTLKNCINEFRYIFDEKNMPALYLFIEKYKQSEIVSLRSFATGLEKDLPAVENAVASDLSNGITEGTNNKIKMLKRTMYGRCSTRLLKAKLMYEVAT